jgi:hypothetical protein
MLVASATGDTRILASPSIRKKSRLGVSTSTPDSRSRGFISRNELILLLS